MKPTALLIAGLTALVGLPSAEAQERRWRGVDGEILPFKTEAQVVDFLLLAKVVERRRLSKGINKHQKLRLAYGGVEAHAVFRTNHVRKPRHTTGGEVYLDFEDSYAFECAAYELSRLLGLDNVPPCVVRKLGKRTGSLQLWIENAMAEDERRRLKVQAPSSIRWVRQQQLRRLFDGLIYNFDRNQGNMLVDENWKLWLIDHGRSFHKSVRVPDLHRIIWCERDLWAALRGLDRGTLDGSLGDLLGEQRIVFLLKRRDVLVRHIEQRIADLGECVVLYEGAGDELPEGDDLSAVNPSS